MLTRAGTPQCSMWLEVIGDNLQAGQSCELHNIQCNIQQKSNEEEEVPGEKIPITKALALAQVMLQSFFAHMYKK